MALENYQFTTRKLKNRDGNLETEIFPSLFRHEKTFLSLNRDGKQFPSLFRDGKLFPSLFRHGKIFVSKNGAICSLQNLRPKIETEFFSFSK